MIKIRKVYPESDEGIARVLRGLDRRCFPNDKLYYALERNYLEDQDDFFEHHWWVAFSDEFDELPPYAAYAGLQVYPGGGTAFFCRDGTAAAYVRRGLQRRLIQTRLAYCRRNKHWYPSTYVLTNNLVSARNYLRCGFRLARGEGNQIWLEKNVRPPLNQPNSTRD